MEKQLSCPHCHAKTCDGAKIGRRGFYFRRFDRSRLRRYFCHNCRRTFSFATTSDFYRSKRRDLDVWLPKLLAENCTQRGAARIMKASRSTIERKFARLGDLAERNFHLAKSKAESLGEVYVDEIETHVHSKYHPVSVAMAVAGITRRIISFEAAQMPARGLLAKKARERYGVREDQRESCRRTVLEEVSRQLVKGGILKSDENPHYTLLVKELCPHAVHVTHPGRSGCVTGQGELKEGRFDPLFCFNHTAAMNRAHISRLFRRTWNTSKTIRGLRRHLYIYANYHNDVLIVPARISRDQSRLHNQAGQLQKSRLRRPRPSVSRVQIENCREVEHGRASRSSQFNSNYADADISV